MQVCLKLRHRFGSMQCSSPQARPSQISSQVCFKDRFKEATTGWWSSRKHHLCNVSVHINCVHDRRPYRQTISNSKTIGISNAVKITQHNFLKRLDLMEVMGLVLCCGDLKNICLALAEPVNATIWALIGRAFKFHPNTLDRCYFACIPILGHAFTALNVATTSGKGIQIQMAFAHLVAAILYLHYFILHHQTLFIRMIYRAIFKIFHFLAWLVALHFNQFSWSVGQSVPLSVGRVLN